MTSSIYHDVEYYFKSFTTFIGKTANADPLQTEWDTQWKSLVSLLVSDELGSEDEEVRILAIGCGEGFRDSLIIREVLQHRPKIYVRAVEPAEEALNVFRSRSEEIVRSHPGVRFDWRAETFEQYVEYQRHGEAGEGGFHLVISGHSLYYMEKWTRALDLMYDQVRPNGMLVVTIVRGKCPYGALMNISRQRDDGKAHMITSDDVSSHLKTKTSQVSTHPREILYDITQVFDETSETGHMLLDFIMQRKHFRKTAPRDFQDTVMDFLRKESKREGDTWLFEGHEEEVVAMKAP